MTRFVVVRNQPRGDIQLVEQGPTWNIWDYDRETVELDIPSVDDDEVSSWPTVLVCTRHGDYRRVVSRREGRDLGGYPETWCSECWADQSPKLTGKRRADLIERHREVQRTFGMPGTLSHQQRERLLNTLDEQRSDG